MTKTLVLYIFHDYNECVEYFINNAIFESSNVDFIVMCNNPSFDIKSKVPSFVKTFNRENEGYDFGGWSDLLLQYNYAYKPYDTYIFVNSSVKGPFMKNHPNKKWTDVFENGLDENISLFGVTINCTVYYHDPITQAHVQSYLFSMKQETVLYLIKSGIFSTEYAKTYDDAVINKEVRMSRLIIEKGKNFGSTLSLYKGVDFRFIDKKPNEYPITFLENIMDSNKYMNKIWTLDELVFVKGNRVSIK